MEYCNTAKPDYNPRVRRVSVSLLDRATESTALRVQWSTIFTMSRKSPRPYEVEVLNYADFNKWDTVAEKYFKGNLTVKISNLRTVTFKKSVANMAFVKYSMNPDAQTEQIEIVKKNNLQIKPCYKAMLPICKKKYTDLNKLCSNNVIPTVYHTEYRSMNNDPKVQNCLAETDEDEVLED